MCKVKINKDLFFIAWYSTHHEDQKPETNHGSEWNETKEGVVALIYIG